ncbi:MAG: hypothetical protein L3J95_04020 [Thermoplasmata archaeon]|nr:hypothetical protein [Thermoplasmata archaeon]MCI4359574.1 hypothetical protein [Thermoplasmata archaeon]
MTGLSERNIAYGFGLLGGLLIALGALAAFAIGAVDLVFGHPFGALSLASEAVVLFVVGVLAGFFSYLGKHGWKDRPFACGVMLVVLSLLGWGFLGFGTNLFSVVGGIFVFLAGVLFLLAPARRAAAAVATA